LRAVGEPYTHADSDTAAQDVKRKTEKDALLAYRHARGLALK
jgi:hypothetical protein